jgi:hypothetical protein
MTCKDIDSYHIHEDDHNFEPAEQSEFLTRQSFSANQFLKLNMLFIRGPLSTLW